MKKSILICEGLDDSMFISYYLHNKFGWDIINSNAAKIFWNYKDFNNSKLGNCHYYTNNTDYLLIIELDGKDNLNHILNGLKTAFVFPSENYIDNLIILLDNDDGIESSLAELSLIIQNTFDCSCTDLKNKSAYPLVVGDSTVNCYPYILPSDYKGELENCLLESLSEENPSLNKIVLGAKGYVEYFRREFAPTKEYLHKRRFIPKAQLSATMSIVNPTASIRYYSDILLSYDWANLTSIDKHYLELVSIIDCSGDYTFKKNSLNRMNIL